MENTSYGINVANRYDLFSIDDEGDDPFQMIASSKQKAQKKQPAQTTADPSAKGAKNSEKENKAQSKATINNENRHPDKHADSKAASGASTNTNLHNQQQQRGEKHGIKETQKDNIRTTREDGNKNGYAAGKNATERRPINKSNFTGENREEKNNRKNREVNNDENAQRRTQAGGGGNKRFESRGKREFDRQSGSNKTGVKAVEKRDGTGSHNWGSAKADAKEYNNFQEDYSHQETEDDKGHASDQGKDEANNANDQSDAKLPIEEELKEMTLDEWKAQTASKLAKPQYNIRKAGEGEDATQWDKMVALDKKKSETEGTEEENETQKIGKQKQVLEIEFHFNDGRRGGLMGRSRGRGGKGGGARNTGKREGGGGGGGAGGGGSGVGGGAEKKDTNEQPREGGAGGGEAGEKRDRRNRPPPPNESTFGSYKFAKQSSRFKNAAPKVDDENFPSLG